MKRYGLIGLVLLVILATPAMGLITISPINVVANQSVTFTATDFGANLSATLTMEKADGSSYLWWNGTAWVSVSKIYFNGIAWISGVASAGQTDSSGVYLVTFNAPIALAGTYKLCFSDSYKQECNSSFTILTTSFTAPYSAPSKSTIRLTGLGYPANENITIQLRNVTPIVPPVNLYWNGSTWVTSRADSNITVHALGNFSADLPLPMLKSGNYSLKVESCRYGGYYNETKTITIVKPQFTVNVTTAPTNATLRVEGQYFSVNSAVNITWENATAVLGWWNNTTKTWNTTVASSEITAGAIGNFTVTLPVPELPKGSYRICANDTVNKECVDFAIRTPVISLNVTSGGIGSHVNVTGNYFRVNSAVNITWENATAVLGWWNGSAWTTSPEPSNIPTGATGNFTVTLPVPSLSKGDYRICANDTVNKECADFTIRPSITVSQLTEPRNISVSGTGFAENSNVTVTIRSSVNASYVNETRTTTDNAGNFSIDSLLLPYEAAVYIVNATDEKGNSASANYNLIVVDFRITSFSVSKSELKVGETLTVSAEVGAIYIPSDYVYGALCRVGFYANETLISSSVIRFTVNGTHQVSLQWTPTIPGNYTLRVVLDPDRIVPETNEVNNVVEVPIRVIIIIPPLPGQPAPPRDLNGDGIFEDLNGNNRLDFSDVLLLFQNLEWLQQQGLISYFDFNRNGRLDFADVLILFNQV